MSDDSHEYDEDALEFIDDERVRIAALHATCPKQIWLQIDPEAEQFYGWDAQTWCSDKINETDVRYVLAASRDAEIQRLQFALADSEALELGTAERCDQLRAQINVLRDAFQTFIDEHEECQDADEWMAELCSIEALHVAGEALATTPKQSLTEYRNNVIEECASVCDKRSMRKNDGNWTDFEWDSICGTNELAADEIRAMKEQP